MKANVAGEVDGQRDMEAYLEMEAVWNSEGAEYALLVIIAIYPERTDPPQIVGLDLHYGRHCETDLPLYIV